VLNSDPHSGTLPEALDSFLLALSVTGRSRQTTDLYRRSIEPLIAFVGKPACDVSPGEIRAFLVPFVLKHSQAQALLRASKQNATSWQGYRNHAMVLTLLDCGLRVSELCGVRVQDLDLAHDALNVTGKGARERQVFFGQRLGRILRSWLSKRTLSLPGEAFFCSRQGYALTRHTVMHLIQKLARQAGLSSVRCSPHTLRHTFATEFIRNGGDPFSLQRLLGHSHISTTMIYVHMAGTTLREAHAKASPVDRLLA